MTQPVPGTAGDVIVSDQNEQLADRVYIRCKDWRVAWKSCVIGQIDDLAGALAIAAYLFIHLRTAWGMVVMIAGLIQIFATLLRVAAVQDGIVLRRLILERVLRNGSMLIGLLLAAVLQPLGPRHGVPIVAVAVVGAGVFGVGEIIRVIQASQVERALDKESTVDEMVWRRSSRLLPVVVRSANAVVIKLEQPSAFAHASSRFRRGA